MPTAAENYKDRPIIIYAPSGIGDKRKSLKLAYHFGKSCIVENWGLDGTIYEDALHMTSDDRVSKFVCITRLPLPAAYVFRLADLQHVPGLFTVPDESGVVQASAQYEPAMPDVAAPPRKYFDPVVLAFLAAAIAAVGVFYNVIGSKS